MKCRILKKSGILAIAIAACMLSSYPVLASDDSKITDEETTEDHAEDTSYSLLRGNNLNFGTSEITRLASNKVNLYGLTQCHRDCLTVYLDMDLERKVDGYYSTYKSWEFTASNVNHLSKSIDVLVPSGYYYRVRGYHAAVNGGTKESTTTLTKGIKVK
ncbi:DUF6147 family protein [Ruminococcus sp. 5_1_39BFAA]|uniref:DUF6147 family protein n=1 Tax=Ruminococcus sp. 5_1_39BFAA TaxID=457412 RepID=UPI00356883FD